MMLYIDGSDIRSIVLATSPDAVQQIPTSPEGYLSALQSVVPDSAALEGIVVVQGPGSATALRASLAIVNTIAFTHGVPLYGVPRGTSFADALAALPVPHTYLEPHYETEARITPSAKDQLRRTQ